MGLLKRLVFISLLVILLTFTTIIEPVQAANRPYRGSVPWSVLLCKFSGSPDSTKTPDFYRDMFIRSGTGGLNDYWQAENRVGMMSQDVVRARLHQLGYTQPLEIRLQGNSPQIIQSPQILQRDTQPLEEIELNNRLVPLPQYDVTTVKDGTDVLLRVDPLSGRIEEIQLGN